MVWTPVVLYGLDTYGRLWLGPIRTPMAWTPMDPFGLDPYGLVWLEALWTPMDTVWCPRAGVMLLLYII